VLVAFHADGKAAPQSQAEINTAVFHRNSEEIWSQGNVGLVDELVSPQYTRHSQATTLCLGTP